MGSHSYIWSICPEDGPSGRRIAARSFQVASGGVCVPEFPGRMWNDGALLVRPAHPYLALERPPLGASTQPDPGGQQLPRSLTNHPGRATDVGELVLAIDPEETASDADAHLFTGRPAGATAGGLGGSCCPSWRHRREGRPERRAASP